MESVSRTEVDSAVTVGTGLENHEFLVSIGTTSRRGLKLEVSEDLEPARFKGVKRKERNIDILGILKGSICVSETKQV